MAARGFHRTAAPDRLDRARAVFFEVGDAHPKDRGFCCAPVLRMWSSRRCRNLTNYYAIAGICSLDLSVDEAPVVACSAAGSVLGIAVIDVEEVFAPVASSSR